MPPQLSVCIPTWQAAAWLPETVPLLLAQQVDLEIIVCDDSSSDETVALARSFEDPRLRVVANEGRLGLGGNWNRALSLARGELVCLFGQDDIAYPGWATALCGLLDRYPQVSFAFGCRDFRFDDDNTEELLGPFFRGRYAELLSGFHSRIRGLVSPELMRVEAMRQAFEINLIGEPSFVVVRRDHPAVGAGFDARLGQLIDWEFYTRFFMGGPIAFTPEVLGAYRLHAASASVSNHLRSVHLREYVYLLDSVLGRYGSNLSWRERRALRRSRRRAISEAGTNGVSG